MAAPVAVKGENLVPLVRGCKKFEGESVEHDEFGGENNDDVFSCPRNELVGGGDTKLAQWEVFPFSAA